MSEKEYTNDWFVQNAVAWDDTLKDLMGKPIKGVELGCFEGRATSWLQENVFTHPDSMLDCVDIWQDAGVYGDVPMSDVERRFRANTEEYKNLTIKKMHSFKYLRTAPPADFIYVDASHIAADCLVDGVLSHMILKPGGVIIFDDYLWAGLAHAPNVCKGAIDAFMECFAEMYDVLYLGKQVILRKRKKEEMK
jgi:hypothetical protein